MQIYKIIIILLLLFSSVFSNSMDFKIEIRGCKISVFHINVKIFEYTFGNNIFGNKIIDARYHEGFLYVFTGKKKAKLFIFCIHDFCDDEGTIYYYKEELYYYYRKKIKEYSFKARIIDIHFAEGSVCVRLHDKRNIIFYKRKGVDKKRSVIDVFECISKSNIVYSKFDQCRLYVGFKNGVFCLYNLINNMCQIEFRRKFMSKIKYSKYDKKQELLYITLKNKKSYIFGGEKLQSMLLKCKNIDMYNIFDIQFWNDQWIVLCSYGDTVYVFNRRNKDEEGYTKRVYYHTFNDGYTTKIKNVYISNGRFLVVRYYIQDLKTYLYDLTVGTKVYDAIITYCYYQKYGKLDLLHWSFLSDQNENRFSIFCLNRLEWVLRDYPLRGNIIYSKYDKGFVFIQLKNKTFYIIDMKRSKKKISYVTYINKKFICVDLKDNQCYIFDTNPNKKDKLYALQCDYEICDMCWKDESLCVKLKENNVSYTFDLHDVIKQKYDTKYDNQTIDIHSLIRAKKDLKERISYLFQEYKDDDTTLCKCIMFNNLKKRSKNFFQTIVL